MADHTAGCAYITAVGAHLPGPAIGNDHIERYLGGSSRALRDRILAASGIRTRHYALARAAQSRCSTRSSRRR